MFIIVLNIQWHGIVLQMFDQELYNGYGYNY
jgi:lysozyme family protein